MLFDAHDGDDVERTGNAVHFGDAFDSEQIVGNAAKAGALNVHENKGGDHGYRIPYAGLRAPSVRAY